MKISFFHVIHFISFIHFFIKYLIVTRPAKGIKLAQNTPHYKLVHILSSMYNIYIL